MADNGEPTVGDVLPIGQCKSVSIDLIVGDLASIGVDLAIVGICSRKPVSHELAVAVGALNHAMHGAIARLRVDGIFSGHWGDTLFLSAPPAPVQAKGVLLLGLGPTGRSVAPHTRRALRSAANQAAKLAVSHAGFAPARLETGNARFNAAASARAILRGLMDVFSVQPGGLRRWSFVAPPAEAYALAEEFRVAFAAVSEQ